MTSLKKLIAVLAVSLPLAASAQQAAAPAAPLYQWYGTLNVNLHYFEASKPEAPGANATGRFVVSTDSSNIGIRGTAETGVAGVGVVYQCETSAAIDGDGIAGICGRNSRLGLSSPYGTLFYGNWDTPLKGAAYGTKADDPFGNTDVYDVAAIIGSPGFKTKSSAGNSAGGGPSATFNVRAANSVAYHSPIIEGFQLKAQVSVNERADLNGKLAPQLYSAAANYNRGPFSIFAAYERHDDYFGANVIAGAAAPATKTSVDTSYKVGAGYELATDIGATTLSAQFDNVRYEVSNPVTAVAGNWDNGNRNAFMVGLKHRMGTHEFRLRYSMALDGDVTLTGPAPATNPGKDTGASNYAIGYAFYLSPAAQVYAFFTYLDNKKAATYTFATAGAPALTGGWGAGANLSAGGLGMRYAF